MAFIAAISCILFGCLVLRWCKKRSTYAYVGPKPLKKPREQPLYLLMVVVIGAEVSLHLCCRLILLMANLHNWQNGFKTSRQCSWLWRRSTGIACRVAACTSCKDTWTLAICRLPRAWASRRIEPYLAKEVALGDADVLLDALLLGNGHLRSGHTGETR